MIIIVQEQPTMEDLLRALREMYARELKRTLDSAPPPLPEDIKRAISE
jgi:hypothetical protein